VGDLYQCKSRDRDCTVVDTIRVAVVEVAVNRMFMILERPWLTHIPAGRSMNGKTGASRAIASFVWSPIDSIMTLGVDHGHGSIS
jgi:hypothetical protein